jgi:hypothetical protein
MFEKRNSQHGILVDLKKNYLMNVRVDQKI